MGDTVSVVYQSSNSFAFLAGVSILSLCKNNQHIKNIDIYLLDAGISDENKVNLRKITDAFNRNLYFINIDMYLKRIKAYGLVEYNGSCAMYMKFFLQECLREDLERILYLDCDTIVNEIIDELWNFNLNGRPMGLAIDCMNSGLKRGYGLSDEKKYYNTGVILFDMLEWKKNKCTETLISYINEKKICYPFVDQDVINVCLNDYITCLPLKYNCISLYEKFSAKEIYYMYDLNSRIFYDECSYQEEKKDPVIIHFPTVYLSRPWYNDCISLWTKNFDEYLYDTKNPFRYYVKGESNCKNLNKIQRNLFQKIPKWMFIRIQRLASKINTNLCVNKVKKQGGG